MTKINWDDPAARLALIEQVGHEEYNRLIKQHIEDSVVARVNGYAIRPVGTRFGRLYQVDDPDRVVAFRDHEEAERYAQSLPQKRAQP
jgi:hypothetical protein